jgi:hypothetical protein
MTIATLNTYYISVFIIELMPVVAMCFVVILCCEAGASQTIYALWHCLKVQ